MDKNPKQEERKEYFHVYVTKEEKRQLEDMGDNYKLQLEIIKTMFSGEKGWLQQEMSLMDDELIKYRALLINYREAYGKAQEEYQSKLEEFWTEVSKGIPSFKDKVASAVKELEPITVAIQQIDKQLERVSKYRIDELLKVVNMITELRSEQLAMFNMLVENFRTPQTT